MKLLTKISMLSIVALSLYSCAKPGCTDPLATNYNGSANKNDGSCTYQTKLIFWQNLDAAQSWSSVGVTSLKYYVNGNYIGSSVATEYYPSQPSCSATGQAAQTINLGQNTTGSVNVKITDQNGQSWYDEYITVNNSECNYYQFY